MIAGCVVVFRIQNCPAWTTGMLGLPGVGTAEMLIVGIIALTAVWQESPQCCSQHGQKHGGAEEGIVGVSGRVPLGDS